MAAAYVIPGSTTEIVVPALPARISGTSVNAPSTARLPVVAANRQAAATFDVIDRVPNNTPASASGDARRIGLRPRSPSV
jgi:hypothetical protein